MTQENGTKPNEEVKALLVQLKEEFHREQTTPLQDKRLTVPVALAVVIIASLVASTWKVSTWYETAINARLKTGMTERSLLRKDLSKLQLEFLESKKVQSGNTSDLDDLWGYCADKGSR